MENVYYTALYKVAKRLDFLLDFCIVKNREKNLVVWPRLNSMDKPQFKIKLLYGPPHHLRRFACFETICVCKPTQFEYIGR